MGIYLAYNGQEPNMEGVIDGAAEMTEAERKVILSGILKVIEMTGDDIDGDGVVDDNDAEEIFNAAHDRYVLDVDSEQEVDGEMYKNTLVFNVDFHSRMGANAPDSVKDFIMKFYEGIRDASTSSSSKVEEIEVDLCAAPNGSYSLSDLLVNPEIPPPFLRVLILSFLPVIILCG